MVTVELGSVGLLAVEAAQDFGKLAADASGHGVQGPQLCQHGCARLPALINSLHEHWGEHVKRMELVAVLEMHFGQNQRLPTGRLLAH